jgi:ketosteroid isomerase-like protein
MAYDLLYKYLKETKTMKPYINYFAVLISTCLVLTTSVFAASGKAGVKASDDELRKKNQATVEKYFTSSLIGTVDLYADDATYSKEDLMKEAVFNSKSFPDWKYSSFKVYSTQDPNKFFAEAAGSGTFYKNGDSKATPVKYSNTYVDVFIMQDGKIKSFEEHMDSLVLLKAMGYSPPEDSTPEFLQERSNK